MLKDGALAFWKVTKTPTTSLVGEHLSWFQPRTVPLSTVAMMRQSLGKCGHGQDPKIIQDHLMPLSRVRGGDCSLLG